MKILATGGMSSGVGKTELICRILSILPGWGVLKTSVRSGRKARPGQDHNFRELITSPAELLVKGKDTDRYHHAGAARVAWLRSGPDGLAAGFREALPEFEGLPGIVVEGNSHTFHHKPDRMILVARTSLAEIKPTARVLLPKADLVILNDEAAGLDRGRMTAEKLEQAGAPAEILIGDITGPGFDAAFRQRVLTWFPQ